MSQQNTPRPNKRQPRNTNRSNPPTPEGTFALRNPSPNTNLLRPQSYYHQPYSNQPYGIPAPTPQQHGFYGYGSQPNAFQDYSSQPSSFPFSHQDYASQTQMGGSSSQPRTDQVHSPINAFSLEDLYTPDFSNPLQDNTGYWQPPNSYEASAEQVATSPTNKKKATRNRQKRMVQSDDAPRQTPWTMEEEIALCKGWLVVSENSKQVTRGSPMAFGVRFCRTYRAKQGGTENERSEGSSKRHKSTGSNSFNTESGEASINLNSNVGDNNEDDVQEIRRPDGKDKAKAAGKKKGSKSSASSSVNEDALARLMVTEMGAQEKQERLAFLEIKRREVECGERELEQQDMRFYLQSYDHLVGTIEKQWKK
uniref:No apical meristem-associated C-terminal domain-containing protein n=1 Tax=Tanacetum cinerariifolium TaxID=118510 RepID=A0A699ISD0_TANCI|nr:hypothetical protein [Tanacetum cinerariifolium]